MSARSKKPTGRPPPIPGKKPSLDEEKTSIYDSSERKKADGFKAISKKTPADIAADKAREVPDTRKVHKVHMRAMSEVTPVDQRSLGYLAPPRDAAEVRARHWRDYVIWGCVSVILASAIALGVWFLGR